MKTPSLLLLLAAAVVASSVFAAPDPAPSAPASAKDRCNTDLLNAAKASALIAPDTAIALTTGTLIDGAKDTKELKLCDATVWHYLAHLGPVPGGQPTVIWNDPALQQDWAGGLPEQLKILTAIDALYKSRVDDLALDALTKGGAVVGAAVKSGVVAQLPPKETDSLAKLKTAGLTADAFAAQTGGAVTAPAAPVSGAAAPEVTDEMRAAFRTLLSDVPPKAAPKGAPGAPAAKAPARGPKEVKPGSAVLAFRRAVITLANELSLSSVSREIMKGSGVNGTVKSDFSPSAEAAPAAKAALVGSGGITTVPPGIEDKEAAYQAALTFIIGKEPIAAANDAGAHAAAALSGLDYGMRNLIALRAAAVGQSVAAAKARLNGASVAEAVGKAPKGGDAKSPPATMGSDVMKRLAATQDYSDLNKLYENGGPKDATGAVDPNWKTSAAGVAVQAQLAAMQKDAAAVTTVPKGQPNAGMLQYSIGGHAVTDQGISVADFKLSPSYRDTIVDAIASNIAAYPMSAQAQAALAAFRGAGQPAAPLAPALTPSQTEAAKLLPPAAPVVVAAPAPGFQPGHHSGLFGLGWTSGPEAAEASYQKDKSQRTQAQVQVRTDVESHAESEAQRVVDSRQAGLQALLDDPNPNSKEQKARVDAYNAATAKSADAQRTAYIATRKDYVPAAVTDATATTEQKKHDDLMDANYSADIGKSIAALGPLYKAAKSDQRSYAEDKSGYKGHWYDDYPIKQGWVDSYFKDNWSGDKGTAAVASCKAALGYKKGGDLGGFKDPSVKNVDERCVRAPLASNLSAYKNK